MADVDDLEEIGDLETYVDQSAVVNMFLSHGYFDSPNCLKEVRAAVRKEKPLMLTHEADTAKGGGPLDAIANELDDKQLRETIFKEGRCITTWYRITVFQLVSLKQIAEFTLLQTPEYKDRDKLDIFVRGDLLRQPLGFTVPVVLYTSPHNTGARSFAAELEACYNGIEVVEKFGIDVDEVKPTHFLLYLNVDTFCSDAGEQLAAELRRARAAKLPIVMAHENDPQRGGCAFERFFQTTPKDLTKNRLYKSLAYAAYPGNAHRAVSLALIAKALGAVPHDIGTSLSGLSLKTVISASEMRKLAVRLLARVKATVMQPRAHRETELLTLTEAGTVTIRSTEVT